MGVVSQTMSRPSREVFTVMSFRGVGRAGFPPADPLRLWGDSLFLGLRGGAGMCTPSRALLLLALLLLALGVLSVSGYQSHVPQIIDVEAVGLLVPRPQVTAEGRVFPEAPSGTTQVTDKG